MSSEAIDQRLRKLSELFQFRTLKDLEWLGKFHDLEEAQRAGQSTKDVDQDR